LDGRMMEGFVYTEKQDHEEARTLWKPTCSRFVSCSGHMIKCRVKEDRTSSYIPEEIVQVDSILRMLNIELQEFETEIPQKKQASSSRSSDSSTRSRTDGRVLLSSDSDSVNVHPHPHPRLRKKKASTIERPTWMRKSGAAGGIAQSVLLTVNSKEELESYASDQITSPASADDKVRSRWNEQFEWMMKNDGYVAMETLTSLEDCRVLLSSMMTVRQPIALQLRIDRAPATATSSMSTNPTPSKSLTAMMHASDQFRSDFMMLKIGQRHCLFMEPF